MIGADEMTIQDKFGNVVFVRRGIDAQRHINNIVAAYAAAGFEVRGQTIMAPKAEIEAAVREVGV
jgi:hypothetical protein